MKQVIFALSMLGVLTVLAGMNDVILNFNVPPAQALEKGFSKYVIPAKGVEAKIQNGVRFYRLRRDNSDPKHRAAIRFHAPKTCTYYQKGSFNVALLARTEANRKNGRIMVYLGCMRIDYCDGQPCVVFMGKGKKFPHLYADPVKIPSPKGDWTHVHVNVNRDGDIALYINGELNVKRSIADRKDQIWVDTIWWAIDAYNEAANADNPIANMDVARLSIREGLMSASQIKEEALAWLGATKP